MSRNGKLTLEERVTIDGRAARDARGDVIERPASILGLAEEAYVRPLQYGDVVRFYENRERTHRMLAALFRRALPGLERCTPADVGRMHAGLPTVLEYVIVAASGLLESDREIDEMTDDEDDLYEGHEIPEPRAMAPEEGSPQEEAVGTLDELEESDLVAFLHERGYVYSELYQLLIPELEELQRGHSRMVKRQERERRKERRSKTSGETANAFQPDADGPPGTAPGYR